MYNYLKRMYFGYDLGCFYVEKKKNLIYKMLKDVYDLVLYVNMNCCFSFVYYF